MASVVQSSERKVSDGDATMRAPVYSSHEIVTVTDVHKIRQVRVNVPRATAVNYKANAALSVLQVATTFRGVATGSCGDQNASGSRDRSGTLVIGGAHSFVRCAPSGARGGNTRRARAAASEREEGRGRLRVEEVQESVMNRVVELDEPTSAVEHAKSRAARGGGGRGCHERACWTEIHECDVRDSRGIGLLAQPENAMSEKPIR
eukprot:5414491-Pleurochrysis_carterae.AAC.3